MSILPTQPQSIGGVLDTTFRLYKASLVSMLPLSFLMLLADSPQYIYMFVRGSFMDLADPMTMNLSVSTLGNYALTAFVGWIGVTWMSAAGALKSASIAAGSEVSVGTAVLRSLARLPWLVIALVLYAVVCTVLGLIAAVPFFAMGLTLSSFAVSCVLAIPCVILAVSLLLFSPICLFDNEGPIGALIGSHYLIWGHWWRTTTILTVGLFVVLVFYMIVSLPFLLLSASGSLAPVGLFSSLIVVALVSLVMTPFYIALILSIFWDLKLRKGGSDLAARVDALERAQ